MNKEVPRALSEIPPVDTLLTGDEEIISKRIGSLNSVLVRHAKNWNSLFDTLYEKATDRNGEVSNEESLLCKGLLCSLFPDVLDEFKLEDFSEEVEPPTLRASFDASGKLGSLQGYIISRVSYLNELHTCTLLAQSFSESDRIRIDLEKDLDLLRSNEHALLGRSNGDDEGSEEDEEENEDDEGEEGDDFDEYEIIEQLEVAAQESRHPGYVDIATIKSIIRGGV